MTSSAAAAQAVLRSVRSFSSSARTRAVMPPPPFRDVRSKKTSSRFGGLGGDLVQHDAVVERELGDRGPAPRRRPRARRPRVVGVEAPSQERALRAARTAASRTRTRGPEPLLSASSVSWAISRPWLMTTTSSTVWATSESTWLESSTVRPSAARSAQEVAQPADALGVEAVGGLVEHEDPRIAEQRGGEAEPLGHAEREAAGAPPGGVAEVDELEHLVGARERDPALGREHAEVVASGPRGMRGGLEHDADLRERIARARRTGGR